ncbi:hypothetical protein [Stenotrophomonas bentonitica]|uniref:hypothetical protein n=1 Tax=Stenotrophomonas bentonitica TaxID=1450134 RepID=UPI0031BA076B
MSFLAMATWGVVAMEPFAPGPEERMLWIPACITLSSMAAMTVASLIQDMFALARRSWGQFLRRYPSVCLEALVLLAAPFLLYTQQSGCQLLCPALTASLLLILLSAVETLSTSVVFRVRTSPTSLIMLAHSGAGMFATYMFTKGLKVTSPIIHFWFFGSVLMSGVLSFLIARFWTNLLRGATVGYSTVVERIIRTFSAEPSAAQWITRHVVTGGRKQKAAKGQCRTIKRKK